MKFIAHFSCLMWKPKWCIFICLPDVATACPDKKSILMYVTSLFQVLPQQVTMEAIREVEMLPRHSKVTREEHIQVHQQHFSQEVSCFTFLHSSCCSKVVVSCTYPISLMLDAHWNAKKPTGIVDKVASPQACHMYLHAWTALPILLFTFHWPVLEVTVQQISALHSSYTALGLLISKGITRKKTDTGEGFTFKHRHVETFSPFLENSGWYFSIVIIHF